VFRARPAFRARRLRLFKQGCFNEVNAAESNFGHAGGALLGRVWIAREATPLAWLINNGTLCKPLVGISNRSTKNSRGTLNMVKATTKKPARKAAAKKSVAKKATVKKGATKKTARKAMEEGRGQERIRQEDGGEKDRQEGPGKEGQRQESGAQTGRPQTPPAAAAGPSGDRLTTSQEEWRRPAAALGRLVCASGVSRVAGCPLLLSQGW